MYLALKPAGLKPGARWGWAAWSPGSDRPASGSFDLPLDEWSGIGRAGCLLHQWLVELNQVHPFEVLVYQTPALPPANAADRHLAIVGRDIGITAHIESYCHHQGVRCRPIAEAVWRRTFLGKGAGEHSKTFERWMTKRCEELGWWRVKGPERDARAMLDHLVTAEGKTPPWRDKPFADLSKAAVA